MVTATAVLKGTAPYSQSKVFVSTKNAKETHDDFENRCWRERMHVDGDGVVFIPPNAMKNCLSEAAKYLQKKVPGAGKATYTKHFEAGVMCLDQISLGISASEVQPLRLHVPADGRRGGTKRVWKNFPLIGAGWSGRAVFHILDPLVTEDVFREHLTEAGNFIGIGFFRPRNNGYYGRFVIDSLKWEARS